MDGKPAGNTSHIDSQTPGSQVTLSKAWWYLPKIILTMLGQDTANVVFVRKESRERSNCILELSYIDVRNG